MTQVIGPVLFAGKFSQGKTFKQEAEVFAQSVGHSDNINGSVVPMTDILSGAPLDSLLRQTKGESKEPLISAQDVFGWAKYDHFKPKRDCGAYVSTQVNPLIALAAGIAHKWDFGRAGWTRLSLKPLAENFPRVVDAIAKRVPEEILKLKTLGSSFAGLNPIIDYIAENTDKYYISRDTEAVLYFPEKTVS